MINFSAGTQNIIKACETAKIKTIYTSRLFIEKAGLEDVAEDLNYHVKIVYLEDLRERISIFDKLLGALKAQNPMAHYHRQGLPDPSGPVKCTSTGNRCLINFTQLSPEKSEGSLKQSN